jgi:hypothetical protein
MRREVWFYDFIKEKEETKVLVQQRKRKVRILERAQVKDKKIRSVSKKPTHRLFLYDREDGRWKMEGERWKMEDGRWKVEGGRWKVSEEEDSRAIVFAIISSFFVLVLVFVFTFNFNFNGFIFLQMRKERPPASFHQFR